MSRDPQLLRVENIETYYGKVAALTGISFDVAEGQVVALLGSNGAGKSTTLRTVSGIIRPSAGKVIFCGEDITRMPSHEIVRRGLVHIPEGRHIFKDLTIVENLELGAYMTKNANIREKRMQKIFERFPILEKRRRQPGGTLSGNKTGRPCPLEIISAAHTVDIHNFSGKKYARGYF